MSQEPTQAISVGELTDHIKLVLEGTFPPLWVSGEISDLARPRSGHIYFTLKDDRAQIRCVIWRNTPIRSRRQLEDGQAVLLFGELDVYGARGSYQLIVRKAEMQGVGALQRAFLKLQAKLDAEGLFDAERKRPLPEFPRRVGIITSPSGAAVRDFLKAAANRWRGVEIMIIPAMVQGAGSAATIVKAIQTANRLPDPPDVLVVSRGGGSLEDLWTFNEEQVTRAVAASEIPTVSAIGHEVDITLCDLAADVRALTPTDAATKVIPDREFFDAAMLTLRNRLQRSMRQTIDQRAMRLESLLQRPIIRKPLEILHLRSRRLDELEARTRRAIAARLQIAQGRMATAAAAISALSPLNVLSRGYSVTMDESGTALESTETISVGDVLQTKLRDGTLESTVTKIE